MTLKELLDKTKQKRLVTVFYSEREIFKQLHKEQRVSTARILYQPLGDMEVIWKEDTHGCLIIAI